MSGTPHAPTTPPDDPPDPVTLFARYVRAVEVADRVRARDLQRALRRRGFSVVPLAHAWGLEGGGR